MSIFWMNCSVILQWVFENWTDVQQLRTQASPDQYTSPNNCTPLGDYILGVNYRSHYPYSILSMQKERGWT